MNRIVPSQIAMVLVTIGAYAIVLASGGSEQIAVAFAVVVGFAAVVTAFAIIGTTAVPTFAAVLAAFGAISITTIGAAVTTIGAAVTTIAAAAFVFVAASPAAFAAEDLGISKRWTLMAFVIGSGAILGALLSGSAGWAIAIGAVGTLALLAMLRFGPAAAPVTATPAPATNGG